MGQVVSQVWEKVLREEAAIYGCGRDFLRVRSEISGVQLKRRGIPDEPTPQLV